MRIKVFVKLGLIINAPAPSGNFLTTLLVSERALLRANA